MDGRSGQPSVGELLKELVGETGVLVRQELVLARTEMALKAKSAAISSSLVLVGAGVGLASLFGIATTTVIALAYVLPLWAACLSVTAVLGVVAATLVSSGLARLKALDPLPTETIASLQEVAKLPSAEPSAMWVKREVP